MLNEDQLRRKTTEREITRLLFLDGRYIIFHLILLLRREQHQKYN